MKNLFPIILVASKSTVPRSNAVTYFLIKDAMELYKISLRLLKEYFSNGCFEHLVLFDKEYPAPDFTKESMNLLPKSLQATAKSYWNNYEKIKKQAEVAKTLYETLKVVSESPDDKFLNDGLIALDILKKYSESGDLQIHFKLQEFANVGDFAVSSELVSEAQLIVDSVDLRFKIESFYGTELPGSLLDLRSTRVYKAYIDFGGTEDIFIDIPGKGIFIATPVPWCLSKIEYLREEPKKPKI